MSYLQRISQLHDVKGIDNQALITEKLSSQLKQPIIG